MKGRARSNAALIVACLALAVALAGTAIAAGVGSIGARELGKVKQRVSKVVVPAETQGVAIAACRPGEQLLGGGATLPGADPAERPSVEQSGPISAFKWKAVANNDDSTISATLRVTALCLKE